MFNPSPQQAAVAEWVKNGSGHLNLVARAGCGKTSTLLWIAPMLQGCSIFLAYNKAIAEEIKLKLKASGIEWKQCEGSTFHAIGFRAWRKAHPHVVVDDRKVDGIINTMAQDALQRNDVRMNRILGEGGQSIKQLVSLAKQQAFGHEAQGTGEDWAQIINHHDIDNSTEATQQELIAIAQDIYRRSIALNPTTIDYDDMILAPLVGRCRFWQYDWVMVDEAQDTNPARRALAMCLLKRSGRLIAVGDPRQAIYGFTGADADAMDIIARRLHSTTLPLNVTYRCPRAIVAHANSIVPDITAHESAPEGSVWEIPFIADEGDSFDDLVDGLGAEDAILCRTAKPLVGLAYYLIKRGKGCRVEGREIGKGLIALATRWKRVKGVKALRNKLSAWASTEMAKAISKGNETKAQSIEDRVDTLGVVCDHVGDDGTVAEVVNQINRLFGDTPPGVSLPNVVTLATVHKSKGREWDRVFIIDRAKLMPSRWAKLAWQAHQEQNLIYVAITRAKQTLVEVDGWA